MAHAPDPNQPEASGPTPPNRDADETVESIHAPNESDAEETVESIRPPESDSPAPPDRSAEIIGAPAPIPPPPPAAPGADPQQQFHLLFELLAVYATRFRDELKQISLDTGKPLHPTTSLFEITSHLLYLLSIAMLDHRQDMQVLRQVMVYCQSLVCRMKDFQGLALENKHLNDVIVARVEQYTKVAHKASSSGSVHKSWVRFLRKNIDAARDATGVTTEPQYVQNDAKEKKVFRAQLLWIYERYAGEYMHCLKHIFETSQDVRTLSPEQLQKLIAKGQQEHRAQIAAKMKRASEKAASSPQASEAQAPPAEQEASDKKKWWKPWSSNPS
ncbi:MAG: hypothetical protein R3236_10140 [Phycisphaeraceae bacterium]|nr:hypothetical protein [Phycisphaeraceae bacterium]